MARSISIFHIAFLFGVVGYLATSSACQKRPALAPAADPLSTIEPPPMGGNTYNDELKTELAILDDVLNDRIDQSLLKRVKGALMTGDQQALAHDKQTYNSHLAKVFLTLPELVHQDHHLSENRKLWLTAKFYFLKRRFIEAAMHMTEVLKAEPDFVDARNWRARAIFFLGNPDLAIKELNTIIKKLGPQSPEGLDALYLVGAIIYESNDVDHERLTLGIDAWTRYLNLADANADLKKEILESLAELKHRKDGRKIETGPANLDPFKQNPSYSPEKNAILAAFLKDEMLLALELANIALTKVYDKDVATIKARILFKTGRIDEAAELFASIVMKDKNYAPGYHYQGMAFMLKGDPKSAVASWQKTVELDPSYAKSHGLTQRIAVAEKMVGG